MLFFQNIQLAALACIRPQLAMEKFHCLKLSGAMLVVLLCSCLSNGLMTVATYQYSLYLVIQSEIAATSGISSLTPELELLSFATPFDLLVTVLVSSCFFVIPLFAFLNLAAHRSQHWPQAQALGNGLALASISNALLTSLMFLGFGGYLMMQVSRDLIPFLFLAALIVIVYLNLILPLLLMSNSSTIKKRILIMPWLVYAIAMRALLEVVDNALLQAYPL